MIDHLSLPVTDLDRSAAFYDDGLKPLGFTRVMEVDEPEAGYRAVGYGPSPDRPLFWVGTAIDGPTETAQQPGLHVAFVAERRAAVDAFHAAALAAGGRDNGAPGLRPEYHENYYGGFILDPDGYHIEACHHAPA